MHRLRKERKEAPSGLPENPITSVQKGDSHIEKPAPQIVQIPKEKDKPAARLGL